MTLIKQKTAAKKSKDDTGTSKPLNSKQNADDIESESENHFALKQTNLGKEGGIFLKVIDSSQVISRCSIKSYIILKIIS